MGIDEAIEILKHVNLVRKFSGVYSSTEAIHEAIETLINEYNNLKQIEEAHRIENGKLREELEQEKEKNNMLKSKLKEHIKFCETESEGSLHNDICKKSLLFDKSLLKILEEK